MNCCNDINLIIQTLSSSNELLILETLSGDNNTILQLNLLSSTNNELNIFDSTNENFIFIETLSSNDINVKINIDDDYSKFSSFISPLTSKWQETSFEVDTIQNNLSSNWQEAFDLSKNKIIDGGYC